MAASISVVIITKNEEANIRRCLESIGWADEIVVVDSGSTDGTPAICSEMGCRVLAHEWEGFARQKNFAASQAQSDWILNLDADEVVTPELVDEIRRVLESDHADDAYTMPRSNSFLGRWMRHGGWYPDRQLRLWRRGIGEFKIVPLHERLEFKRQVKVGCLSNPILHYTYPAAADFIRKADLYTNIEAAAMVSEGRLPRSLVAAMALALPSKFAEVYIYKGGWKDGLHGFIAAFLMSMRLFLRYVKVWEAANRTR
jgi:glycosyltransferase involved in cell wall biosynthesis